MVGEILYNWNDTAIILLGNILFSYIAYYISCVSIENCKKLFIAAGLKGRDYGRKEDTIIPEAVGVISGTVYIICLFVFIALPYVSSYVTGFDSIWKNTSYMIEYLAALLSITSMILLGFADDVLNLRWRYKLILPLLSSIPLVLVYITNNGSTTMVMPIIARCIFGKYVNIGIFYYIFMICLTIFCSNSINIYSGINGLEVGQSIIIAISLIIFGIIETIFGGNYQTFISIYILIPFLAVSLSLFKFNKYPANVFVGDTFCYFAGMTFAVVGILSHNCKTLLLFFLPQILNFLLSLPQLLHMFPCPRHRLPMFDEETLDRHPSQTTFKLSSLDLPGCIVIGLMSRFGMAEIFIDPKDPSRNVIADNMTLLNVVLRKYGPMKESELLDFLLKIQVVSSLVAFLIRYPIAWLLYYTI